MKIIHCADIHMGSRMDSRLPAEKAAERRREIRSAFAFLADYAAANEVKAIMLSGDIFETNFPPRKDREFFYSVIRNNPDIDFLYLRGNHDAALSTAQAPDNLKTFGREWRCYGYGGVNICGMETDGENLQSAYRTLALDPEKINIVMMHGTADLAGGGDRISLNALKNKNIDYLALGHIHTFDGVKRLDGRGVYCYSGCLEGRGFDESGEKGFVLLDIGKGIKAEFVPFAFRRVMVYSVDVTGAEDGYAVYCMIKNTVNCKKSDMVRVVLKGESEFGGDLAAETEKRLARENYFFCDVKDETERKFDISEYDGDVSLKGEFIRSVLAETGFDDKQKQAIIAAGLKALDGRGDEI